MAPSMCMRLPRPVPHMELAKSPRPSAESSETGELPGGVGGKGRHAQGIEQLGGKTRKGIARDSYVINISEGEARFLQAIADRGCGESRRIFDAIEAFLLDRGNQPAVTNQRCGGVAVVRIDSEYV